MVPVTLLLAAVILAVLGDRRTASANPDRQLRFHWRRPEPPVTSSRAAVALQVLSMACLAAVTYRWFHLAWPLWMLPWIGLLLAANLAPRAVVWVLHNRRLRRVSPR